MDTAAGGTTVLLALGVTANIKSVQYDTCYAESARNLITSILLMPVSQLRAPPLHVAAEPYRKHPLVSPLALLSYMVNASHRDSAAIDR